MHKIDQWNTSHFQKSPIIGQLCNVTYYFTEFPEWPTLEDYQSIFKLCNIEITPVEQSLQINSFEEQYEPRVFLKRELQTRLNNWHDFFNALIWLSFPHTKKALNALHYRESRNRQKGTNRSTLENRITQFDECGALIISSNQHLLDLIQHHKWKELFINNAEAFKNDIKCLVFGHAIYEKALSPYIGMTCHCLLVNDEELLNDAIQMNYANIDRYMADKWINEIAENPVKFNPYPVLGTPDYWYPQDNEFYSNKSYFR